MRFLSIALTAILLVSTTEAAARPRQMRRVTTAGTVWINAAALPSGSTIYDGDTIATAQNGFALLTAPPPDRAAQASPPEQTEGRVEVRPDSLISVGTDEITLKSGVVGSDGFAVRVGHDVVRPASGGQKNWFVVAERDGQQLVAAHEGDLLIARADGEPIFVPAGSYAIPGKSSPAENADGSPGKPPGVKEKDRWMIFSLFGSAGVMLIVVMGASATFGTILGRAIADNPVSPAQ